MPAVVVFYQDSIMTENKILRAVLGARRLRPHRLAGRFCCSSVHFALTRLAAPLVSEKKKIKREKEPFHLLRIECVVLSMHTKLL